MKNIIIFLLSFNFSLSAQNNILKNKIDSIISLSIKQKAFPGAQIVVLKDGEEVINKSYGYHTYDSINMVTNNSIYDLASITKPTAGAFALMSLYEDDLIDINSSLSNYVKYFKNTKVGDNKVINYLQHITGIRSWIPFHETTKKDNGDFKKKTLSFIYKKRFNIKLTDSLYLYKNYKKEIYKQIKNTNFIEGDTVLYSGLFYYLIPEIVKTLSGDTFDNYLEKIYNKAGLKTMVFNPLKKFRLNEIVPTEDDNFFRNFQIHGVVHDEGAAMMNGVSANAGLFSTASDLSKFYQIFLDGDSDDKNQVIDSDVVRFFTEYDNENQNFYRGLGFDKPKPKYDIKNCTYSRYVSDSSYGHSGYTGTFFWVDPEYNLIYVFLSNRVYDSRENRKISELNIRTNIHDLIYENLVRLESDIYF
ncbi:MAG: serine hydrolase [Flammeovirgaceae bacterium TMED290]|nr:MAG: serine hydrolase [Flammeovirgaceae bacterium TMED290]|tara:strand:+ start:10145 stop:11395 length:1251 start_codon:yes stop_codon:yes gene_type:complete